MIGLTLKGLPKTTSGGAVFAALSQPQAAREPDLGMCVGLRGETVQPVRERTFVPPLKQPRTPSRLRFPQVGMKARDLLQGGQRGGDLFAQQGLSRPCQIRQRVVGDRRSTELQKARVARIQPNPLSRPRQKQFVGRERSPSELLPNEIPRLPVAALNPEGIDHRRASPRVVGCHRDGSPQIAFTCREPSEFQGQPPTASEYHGILRRSVVDHALEIRQRVLFPSIAFGRPVLVRRGVTTTVIRERIDAGEPVQSLSDDYDLTAEEIGTAILYERAA